MDVAGWLHELGLERYEPAFRDNAIDGEVLVDLTDADLERLGVLLGHRKKLLKAIAALNADASSHEPASAVPPARNRGPPVDAVAERRQLTVMFCDLVGSTVLSSRLDPEEMREIIRAYQNAVTGEIARFEGHVAKFMGDGVLAYFGWPRAHEDEAERAVGAGLAITQAVCRLKTPSGEPLAVRVAIATGLVVVGDLIGTGSAQEQAIVGETPNLAARLQDMAEANTVVIAASTYRLISGHFDCVDLGRHSVKGYIEPIEAWRVIGPSNVESRFAARHQAALTPLVGREHSLGLLLDCWARAQQGEGQVVLLSGESGIGKSRIIEAAREHLANQPGTHLRYFCSPNRQDSALYPFIAQLERAAGIHRNDAPGIRLDKLEGLLNGWTRNTQAIAPLFAALLSIPFADRYAPLNLTPQRQRDRTLDAFVDLLAGIAALQPVMMIVDDVHWLDPTSLDLLDRVVPRVKDLAVLLVITFRPEFAPSWSGHAHVSTLPLDRLGRRQSTDLVARVAGDKILPEDVVEQIVDRAEGVPLFVEELTKTVLESDAMAPHASPPGTRDRYSSIAIPATLHDSLMARLDRLPAVKEVAQIGAVIGREFSYRILAAVTRAPEDRLRLALDQLVASALLFRRGAYPEAILSFKHALIQDAAYQSLLRSRRQELHAKTALVLEEELPEVAENAPELVAHHCTHGRLPDRAVDWWQRAARHAAARSSHVEAIRHLKKALEVLATLPEGNDRARRELATLVAMGVSYQDVEGPASPESVEIFARARALSDRAGDAVDRFGAHWGLWRGHLWRGDIAIANALVEDLIGLAERESSPALLLQARHAQWTNTQASGNLVETLNWAELGLSLYDPAACQSEIYRLSGHDPGVCAYGTLAQMSWLLGYPDRAEKELGDALRIARQLAHPSTVANALSNAVDLELMRGDAATLREFAEQLIALATEQDFAGHLSRGRFARAWAMFLQDHGEERIALMRETLPAVHGSYRNTFHKVMLVEAHRRMGRVAEALTLVERGFADQTDQRPEQWLAAEVARLIAESFADASSDRREAAETMFKTALNLARRQGAKALELRASVSLARFWRGQGRSAQAHDLLAPIYGWFTEGFETPDLKDAKSLLDTLK